MNDPSYYKYLWNKYTNYNKKFCKQKYIKKNETKI